MGPFWTRRDATNQVAAESPDRVVGPIGTHGDATLRFLPLYEAKMIHQLDPQWATYERDGTVRDVTQEEKAARDFYVMPRYWVAETEVDARLDPWREDVLLGFRNIARTTDERTVIASRFPRCAVGHSMPLMFTADPSNLEVLELALSSLALDYVARQKVGGVNLTFGYVMQFAVPSADRIRFAARSPACSLIAELGRNGLDGLMFHSYGVNREDAAYILDTFTVLQRKEQHRLGEYRTRRLVLEAYDRLGGGGHNAGGKSPQAT